MYRVHLFYVYFIMWMIYFCLAYVIDIECIRVLIIHNMIMKDSKKYK